MVTLDIRTEGVSWVKGWKLPMCLEGLTAEVCMVPCDTWWKGPTPGGGALSRPNAKSPSLRLRSAEPDEVEHVLGRLISSGIDSLSA
jgi:hypothetical protein